jgi:hypothetical protein
MGRRASGEPAGAAMGGESSGLRLGGRLTIPKESWATSAIRAQAREPILPVRPILPDLPRWVAMLERPSLISSANFGV